MFHRLILLGALLVLGVGCGGEPTAPVSTTDDGLVIAGTFDLTEIRIIDVTLADSAIFPLHAVEGSFLELTFSDPNKVEGSGLLIFDYWLGEIPVSQDTTGSDSTGTLCLLGNFADNSVPGSTACVEPLEFEGFYDTSQGVVALVLIGDASYTWLDVRTSGIAYELRNNELVFDGVFNDGSTFTIKYARR